MQPGLRQAPTGEATQGIHPGPPDLTDQPPQGPARTFEQAIERVGPAAQAIITQLRAMAETPNEVHVEFGVDLHAEAGAFVASKYHANFKVSVTWRDGDHPVS